MGVEIPTDASAGHALLVRDDSLVARQRRPNDRERLEPAMQALDVFDPLDGAGQSRQRGLQERAAARKLRHSATASRRALARPDIGMLERAITIHTKAGRNVDIGLRLIWNETPPTFCTVTLQRGSEEFPTMHGVDLHGGAAASVPVNLLANPAHFPRTPDRPRPPSACAGCAHGHVLRQLLDGSEMESNRPQQNACI